MYSSQTYTALKKHFANPRLGGSACFLENYYVIFRKGVFFVVFLLFFNGVRIRGEYQNFTQSSKEVFMGLLLFVHSLCTLGSNVQIYDIVSPSLRWTFEVA